MKLGNDTLSVLSCVRWAMLAVAEMLHLVPGGRYVRLTVLDLVFSVKSLE